MGTRRSNSWGSRKQRRPKGFRLIAAALVAVIALTGCSGGYNRQEWQDTFTSRYGFSPTSAACVLDRVEAQGIEDRFAGDSVDIDAEIEAIIRDCVPITERALVGIGF